MTATLLQSRKRLEAKIEELISLLDVLDGDPDLEENGDDEQMLGWPDHGPNCLRDTTDDDREVENEHGGDIQDEPHDDLDQGDSEPNLGWPEKDGQGKRIGLDCGPGDFTYDPCDTDGIGQTGRTVDLSFNGDGHHIGRKLLREHIKDQRKLMKAMDQTRVPPGYGRYV